MLQLKDIEVAQGHVGDFMELDDGSRFQRSGVFGWRT